MLSSVLALLAMQMGMPGMTGTGQGMDGPYQLQTQGSDVTVFNEGPVDVEIQVDGVNQPTILVPSGGRGGVRVPIGLATLHIRRVNAEMVSQSRNLTGAETMLVVARDGGIEWVNVLN